MSHLTRVRGLKPYLSLEDDAIEKVAPHAGAWIETSKVAVSLTLSLSRTSRGCVD